MTEGLGQDSGEAEGALGLRLVTHSDFWGHLSPGVPLAASDGDDCRQHFGNPLIPVFSNLSQIDHIIALEPS